MLAAIVSLAATNPLVVTIRNSTDRDLRGDVVWHGSARACRAEPGGECVLLFVRSPLRMEGHVLFYEAGAYASGAEELVSCRYDSGQALVQHTVYVFDSDGTGALRCTRE